MSCCFCSGCSVSVLLLLLIPVIYFYLKRTKIRRKKMYKYNNTYYTYKTDNPYDKPPPYFNIYANKHKEWVQAIYNHSKSRTLVYSQHPSGGMGNKLRTLIGTTFLAMMTDRAILLRNWNTFNTYFSSPLSTINAPNEVSGGRRYYDYITCFNENQIKEISTINEDNLSFLTCCDLTDLFIKYGNFGDKMKKYGLITDRSKNIIEKQANEIRYFLYRFFYKPSGKVISEMTKITNRFSSDKMTIGFHFRTNHQGWNDRGVTFLNAQQIEQAIQNATKLSKKLKKVQWYISTDDNEILKKYKAQYPQYVVNDVYEKQHSRGSASRVTDAFIFSVVESHVLANCDILFLTASSSFSGVAYYKSKLSVLEFLTNKEKKCKECNVVWV